MFKCHIPLNTHQSMPTYRGTCVHEHVHAHAPLCVYDSVLSPHIMDCEWRMWLQGVEGCLPAEPTVGETYSIPLVLLMGWGSTGSTKTVTRYVTVAPACPVGERLCGDVCSPVPCGLLPGVGSAGAASRLPAGTAIQLLGPPSMKVRPPVWSSAVSMSIQLLNRATCDDAIELVCVGGGGGGACLLTFFQRDKEEYWDD